MQAAQKKSYTVTEAFAAWLDHHTPFHGAVHAGDEWLTAEAWPDPRALEAAWRCTDHYERGDLDEAREALIEAQSITEGIS